MDSFGLVVPYNQHYVEPKWHDKANSAGGNCTDDVEHCSEWGYHDCDEDVYGE